MVDQNKINIDREIAKLEKKQLDLRKLYTTALDKEFTQRKIMELEYEIRTLKKML